MSKKKQRPEEKGAITPSTQNKPLGGLFSPLAQYPGAGYAEVFATARGKDDATFLKEHASAPVVKKTVVRTKGAMANIPDHFFTSALLLVDDESNARMDRNALREAGIAKVQVLTSGVLAARFLAHYSKEVEAKHIDVIVCHPHLGDMSALQWIELLSTHPVLKNIPVLGIAGSEDAAKLLRAFGDGFAEILVRPYSHDDVRRILYKIQESALTNVQNSSTEGLDDTAFSQNLKRLQTLQSEDGRAERFVQDGLQWLKMKEWDKAITALSKALHNQEMRGEAEYGLAVAWQGKKNIEKYCYYLSEACLSLVRSQKWAKARMAYTQLLKFMPSAANPFVAVAENLIRAQRYRDAAGTLVLGLPLGNAQDATQRLARACYYAENPPFAVSKIQKAFTAPMLQKIVQELPDALKQITEEHEQRLQQRREERAALRLKTRSLPQSTAYTAPVSSAKKGADSPSPDATYAQSPMLVSLSLEDTFSDSQQDLYDAEDKASKSGMAKGVAGRNSSENDSTEGSNATRGQKSKKSKNDSAKPASKKEQAPLLQPLFEEDMAVDMFSPKLNDIATVIKTTWKIMKGK